MHIAVKYVIQEYNIYIIYLITYILFNFFYIICLCIKLIRLHPTSGKFGRNSKLDMGMRTQCVKCFELSVVCKLCTILK